jgi:hypothetical protein
LTLLASLAITAGAQAKPDLGLSTENLAEFQTVQHQLPLRYYAPFVGWKGADDLDRYLSSARSLHVRPMISWETWDARSRIPSTRNRTTPGLFPAQIASGQSDKYIVRNAKIVKHYKKTVYIRFDHEFNGDWYPWGTSAKNYVKMWRHVWGVFHRLKVHNVKWIWSPNLNTFESDAVFDARVKQYFPGSKYVDIIGATVTRVQVQGGTLNPNDPNNGYYQGPGWFFTRFDRLGKYTDLGRKPMWITEALVDLEEMQAWMPPFRAEIDKRPAIKTVIWLTTTGPQNKSFGNMNWKLSDQPFARAYLNWNAPPPVVATASTK